MHYGKIITNHIANGTGIRLSLFVSGCDKHCEGCFNKETWDPNYGQEFTEGTLNQMINELKKPQYDGLTILGGEPMLPINVETTAFIIERIKQTLPEINIWIYTGYLYEELKSRDDATDYILNNIDVLVDGPFVLSKKDITLQFRGSSNQRILHLKGD